MSDLTHRNGVKDDRHLAQVFLRNDRRLTSPATIWASSPPTECRPRGQSGDVGLVGRRARLANRPIMAMDKRRTT